MTDDKRVKELADLIMESDKAARLEIELGRAYRALHGFYACYAKGERPNDAMLGYHSLTIAAAARFVNQGALDGAEYFIGKSVDVLHDAMKPQ